MILLIDNYDSFTYNLAHLFGELGAEVVVRRNDEIAPGRGGGARPLAPRHLTRPRPARGRRRDAGDPAAPVRPRPDSRRLPRPPGDRAGLRRRGRPGARARARQGDDRHATTAAASSPGCRRTSSPAATTRSRRRRCPTCFEVSATAADGEVMAVRHRELPVDGVQFHPESVLTPLGRDLARNFLGARDDPGRARPAARRPRPHARRGARRDGHDHVGRGDAGPDRRLPRRAAAEGRDGRRDRRLRRGDARARARRCGRSATTSSTRPAPAATARTRSTSRPPPRSSPPRPARASRSTATARSRRRPGSADVLEALGFELELAAGADRAVDRRARLRLPVRADAPSRDAARRRRSARELAARTVFNVLGPLTNPAGARAQVVGVYSPELVPVIADVLAQARRAPRVRRPRRRRHRRALARRAEPRLRGRRRRRAPARDRPARARHPALRPGRAARRHAGRERADDPRGLRRRDGGGRRSAVAAERRRRDRRGGHAADLARGLEARARARSTRAPPPSGSSELVAFSRATVRGMRFRRRSRAPGFGAIAEFKRRSPSAGDLRPDGDVARSRTRLRAAGARAMSVLVDERFGGIVGRPARRARGDALPLLAKGFFSTPDAPAARRARRAPTRRCCSCATSTTRRAPRCMRTAERARPRHARRGARRRGARARDRARRAGDRRQRARPLDLRDRPRARSSSCSRARRATAS